MSENDFNHILEYSDMCDLSRCALLRKEPRSETVDYYLEFHDELDNFEVIAKRLLNKNPTAASGIAKKSFLLFGRSCLAVAWHIVDE